MKRKTRALFDPYSPLIPTSRLIRFSGEKILLPFYHAVSDQKLPHISNLYVLRNIQQFKADLTFLLKHYTPVSIDQLHQIISENTVLTKPVFHLTFDDGLREIKDVIAPVLQKKNIPATVFLNTDFVDNKDLFYRYKVSLIVEKLNNELPEKSLKEVAEILHTPFHKKDCISAVLQLEFHQQHIIDQLAAYLQIDFRAFLEEKKPYLTKTDIKDLENQGFRFGSHSTCHPLFSQLNLSDQKEEITKSFIFLKEFLNIDKNYFSFPFSDNGVSAEFINWLHQLPEMKLSFGTAGLKKDVHPKHLQRIPMEGNDLTAKQIIHSEYLYFLIKRLLNKNRIHRR